MKADPEQGEAAPTAIERPLTATERRTLSQRLTALERERKRLCRRLPVTCLAGFVIFSAVTILASDVPARLILPIWFVVMALIGAWIAVEDRLRNRRLVKRLRDTLNAGRAREVRIIASAVIEFEEQEDEGACYAFQIADERIVFIAGQDFYPSAKFPNTEFALIDIIGPSGQVEDFLIRKSGEKLKPLRTIPVNVKARLRVPEHLEVIHGNLGQLEQLLEAEQ